MSVTGPQTKRDIVGLLQPSGFRPSRRRGQSFLIDGNLMRLVVRTAELTGDDCVLEVGTGTGSLTRMLADVAGTVVTVEMDSTLASVARDVLGTCPNVTVLHADVLAGKSRINPDVLRRLESAAENHHRVKLVANLPYAVATPVIVELLFERLAFERMVFTVQKEVADRLRAKPGTRDYGWASVVVAAAGEIKSLRAIPPAAFWPKPAVDSSLVMLRPREGWHRGLDMARFRDFGKFVFQHRRKTVLRILREFARRAGSEVDASSVLVASGVESKTRGDQLKPEDILKLSQRMGA